MVGVRRGAGVVLVHPMWCGGAMPRMQVTCPALSLCCQTRHLPVTPPLPLSCPSFANSCWHADTSTRQSFNTLFGACPYCSTPITVKVA